MGEDRGSVSELNHSANLRRFSPCRLDRLASHGTSASEVGPGPGVISVGHCFKPNGTAGGRNGFMPRFSVSAMMAARASPPTHQLIVHRKIAVSAHIFLLPAPGLICTKSRWGGHFSLHLVSFRFIAYFASALTRR